MEETTKLLIPLFGLLTAAIPLVLAIFALRSNRIIKTTEPLETQSFLVSNIVRIPVEEHKWKRYKAKKLFKFILYMIILIGIAPIVEILVPSGFYNTTNNDYTLLGDIILLIIFANIVLAVILIILYRNSYIHRCHSAYQGRYALFKEAQILIKSDYLELFNKCHEVLKIMVTQVIEVNFDAQLIDAFIPGTLFSHARSIVVHIQAVEGKEGFYKVLVESSRFAHNDDKDQVSVSSSEESSQIINRFINLLISVNATGSTDKNTKKETEAA
jgi:hypothetical protein